MPVARKLWFADPRGDARTLSAAADHGVGVRLQQRRAGEPAGAAADGAEQRPLRVVGEAGAVKVGGAGRPRGCGGRAWRAPCRPSRAAAPRDGGWVNTSSTRMPSAAPTRVKL